MGLLEALALPGSIGLTGPVAVHPALAIPLVLGGLVAVLGGLRWYRHTHHLPPELTRKLVHVTMGLVTLTFPWLFAETWPVLLLGGLTLPGLIGLRLSRRLHARLGGVIDAVERTSWGELCFPISVVLLFVLSNRDPILYGIPILVLTLADAAAALIGVQYGLRKYRTIDGDQKSLEGSVAFFGVTFLSVHIPLLLFTGTGRTESLLIALVLALLVTFSEAIAWRGLDNLFIPLGSFMLLKEMLLMGQGELVGRLAVLVVLGVAAVARRHVTTLDPNALLGALLVGYVIWASGGWAWIAIPLILFLRDRALPSVARSTPHIHSLDMVISVAVPTLFWLLLAVAAGQPAFYFPYAVAFAAHQAAFDFAKLMHANPARSLVIATARATAVAWFLVFVPYVLFQGAVPLPLSLALSAGALALVFLATTGFARTQPSTGDIPRDVSRWVRQASWSAIVSFAAVVPIILLR
jgi:phytol kinase